MSARQTAAVLVAGLAGVLFAPSAAAATWVSPATTPSLSQVVAIDATGESGWLYGSEDLAGDGATFQSVEQAIDIRTAYAATDASRFWARVYVSAGSAIAPDVTVFVFIDADNNPATGGSAAAAEIDPKLTTDPSMGGYEYAIAIRGNGTIDRLWTWTQAMNMFVGATPMAMQASAESGIDSDPISVFGSQHGYLQASVNLSLVGLTQACSANLYFRSVNAGTMGGAGDLDVGQVAPCVPVDANNDGVPDEVVPPAGCTSDDQCPGNGRCENGNCVLPHPCMVDADCAPNERCDAGSCVPRPTPCSENADCADDQVCTNGLCGPCTQSNDTCGPGRHCEPDGRCMFDDPENASGGIPLDPGDVVQGGACTCRAAGETGQDGPAIPALLCLGAAATLLRRTRARARGKAPSIHI